MDSDGVVSDARVWQGAPLAAKYVNEVRAALPLAQEQIDIMLRLIDSFATDTSSFLDLGCGSGVLGASLLERFPGSRCVFADFSPPMLDAAREALAPFEGRTEFVEMDYSERSWLGWMRPHGPFDAVVSGYSIHHQTDARKREIYAEIHELLVKGGMFINVEHVKSASPHLEAEWNELLTDSLYQSAIDGGKDSTREAIFQELVDRPDKDANILAMVEDQCAWLREIGYVNVDCYLKVMELAVFGGQKRN